MQDALITVLSEKTLPIPELGDEVQAIKGFNVIATANDRDKGVNELSSASRRRFNTVVLPLPEQRGGRGRASSPPASPTWPRPWSCPRCRRPSRRSAGWSRSSASCGPGSPSDGRTTIKSPSGTLSAAEAISVVTSGLALSAHFGDGRLRPEDVAAGLVGAVIKDPVADRVAWTEYLEVVVREREGWSEFYTACRDVL